MFTMRSPLLLTSAVLLLSWVSATTAEDRNKLLVKELSVFTSCMQAENISQTVADDLFQKSVVADRGAAKCLFGCHFKGMGYLTDDGKMDWKKLDEVNKIEYTDPKDIEKSLEADEFCSKTVSQNFGNHCDAGYAAAKCFFEEAKKRNLKIIGPDAVA